MCGQWRAQCVDSAGQIQERREERSGHRECAQTFVGGSLQGEGETEPELEVLGYFFKMK